MLINVIRCYPLFIYADLCCLDPRRPTKTPPTSLSAKGWSYRYSYLYDQPLADKEVGGVCLGLRADTRDQRKAGVPTREPGVPDGTRDQREAGVPDSIN